MLHAGQVFTTVLHPQAVEVDLCQLGLEITFGRHQYFELSAPDGILVGKRIIEAITDASEHATSPRGAGEAWWGLANSAYAWGCRGIIVIKHQIGVGKTLITAAGCWSGNLRGAFERGWAFDLRRELSLRQTLSVRFGVGG